MAPTLSFWDCGEFIASAYTLGVPHPPGTPFFVVIGKFFITLGLFKNIAMNTNFISVLSSAITTWISYIIVVRVSQRLPFKSFGNPGLGQIGIRIGAFVSSLFLAFSSTYWFNAVETEVYGMAMLMMMLIIYLTIRWADEKENGGSDKLLIVITYLLFLSISIHLTVFLVVPALFLFIILIDKEKMKDWLFWVTWAILFSVAVPVYFFVGMVISFVDDKSFWIWVALLFLGAFFTGLVYYVRKIGHTGRINIALAFWLFLAAIVGYSTHIYIPIRASQNPAINENDPSSFSSFEQYIERKQYGQESMITRMFTRRAQLSNQFGRHENMGFGGYFIDQYTSIAENRAEGNVPILVYLLNAIIFGLGIFGIIAGLFYALRFSKLHPMVLLFLIFFISSFLMIMYLNFADGTKPDPNSPGDVIQLEVRERDYFYTPAFVIFATIFGVGMAALLRLLGDGVRYLKTDSDKYAKYGVFGGVALILLLAPINPLRANYQKHDRSKDYAPADYAYNILQSCKPRSIIFTNGDNDTFPLWYLQEVEKVRNDVRVVNLSLLNTDWYILQLKHQMGIKMYIEDNQIAWIEADRRGNLIYYRPAVKFMDKIRNRMRFLTPEQDPRTGQIMRVQDQMIEQIVIANLDVPIYFSGSVPTSNRWTLNDRLIRQGIVLQVDPDTTKPRIDLAATDSLINKVYKYSGLNDLSAFKDENNVGLTTTFPERFSELADAYKAVGDTNKAINLLWKSVEKMPYYHQTYLDLMDAYNQIGNKAMADSALALGIKNLKAACEAWPEIVLYHQFLGVVYYQGGKLGEAYNKYKTAYALQPDNSIAFRLLRDICVRMNDPKKLEEARNLMVDWSRRHPEDLEIQNQLNRIR